MGRGGGGRAQEGGKVDSSGFVWLYHSTSKSSVNTGVTLHSLKMHDLFKDPSVIQIKIRQPYSFMVC